MMNVSRNLFWRWEANRNREGEICYISESVTSISMWIFVLWHSFPDRSCIFYLNHTWIYETLLVIKEKLQCNNILFIIIIKINMKLQTIIQIYMIAGGNNWRHCDWDKKSIGGCWLSKIIQKRDNFIYIIYILFSRPAVVSGSASSFRITEVPGMNPGTGHGCLCS